MPHWVCRVERDGNVRIPEELYGVFDVMPGAVVLIRISEHGLIVQSLEAWLDQLFAAPAR